MKPPTLVFAILATALAGLVAYLGGRALHGIPHDVNARNEIHWMKKELGLGDADFAKVEALHLAYVPRCDALCMAVAESGRKVRELAAATSLMTEELSAAIAEDERVRAECRKALLAHLYETAAEMPSVAGKRFLELALPSVLSPGHPDVHDSVRQ